MALEVKCEEHIGLARKTSDVGGGVSAQGEKSLGQPLGTVHLGGVRRSLAAGLGGLVPFDGKAPVVDVWR